MAPEAFITRLNGLPVDLTLCRNGYCYRFAQLLKAACPGGVIEYDREEFHVAYRWTDSRLYDATGEILDTGFSPMTMAEKSNARNWVK